MVLEDFSPCMDVFKYMTKNRGKMQENFGTPVYTCPEFFATGKYNGEQATVYSLGMTLFTIVCGKFPKFDEEIWIRDNTFHRDGVSEGVHDSSCKNLPEGGQERRTNHQDHQSGSKGHVMGSKQSCYFIIFIMQYV